LHLWRRELDEAEENLQLALGMIETSGFVPMRILSLTYLTVVNRFRKKVDEVSEYARRAMLGAETAHMPDYIAAAKGNLAWVAWRRQDLHYARQLGQEAMQIWEASPLLYPFQWQALWPLIGVTLAEGDKDDTWSYLTKLYETTQQLLPDGLGSLLLKVIQTKDQADENEAHSEFEKLITLASEMGYL
jgi:hypothetical protein